MSSPRLAHWGQEIRNNKKLAERAYIARVRLNDKNEGPLSDGWLREICELLCILEDEVTPELSPDEQKVWDDQAKFNKMYNRGVLRFCEVARAMRTYYDNSILDAILRSS